jgi:hypothetical protein
MFHAAEKGRADCLRLLLEAGADKDTKNNVRIQLAASLLCKLDRVVFAMSFICCAHEFKCLVIVSTIIRDMMLFWSPAIASISFVVHYFRFVFPIVRFFGFEFVTLMVSLSSDFSRVHFPQSRASRVDGQPYFGPRTRATRTARGCCWMPVPTRRSKTLCVDFVGPMRYCRCDTAQLSTICPVN